MESFQKKVSRIWTIITLMAGRDISTTTIRHVFQLAYSIRSINIYTTNTFQECGNHSVQRYGKIDIVKSPVLI